MPARISSISYYIKHICDVLIILAAGTPIPCLPAGRQARPSKEKSLRRITQKISQATVSLAKFRKMLSERIGKVYPYLL